MTGTLHTGCARRHLLRLDGCAQRVAMSVHFFVIEGDFWYQQVLVDNGNASFAVSCKLSWSPVRQYVSGTSTGEPLQIIKAKWFAATCSSSGPQVSGEWFGTCGGHDHVTAAKVMPWGLSWLTSYASL